LTNRLLAPLARTVMQGFPGVLQGDRVVTTGNPVRKDIMRVSVPEERMVGRDQQPLRLLVLGGSLGAKVFNDIMPETLHAMPAASRVEVWHQTGINHFEVTRARYEERGITTARLMPFIDDMAGAYAWADIVLCRAGALTVSELCIVGAASILVPFPYAADDHQTANARYLADAGGAVLLSQQELTVARITGLLSEFDRDRTRLIGMAVAARKQAYPDATADIAAICMGVING
ncbi:MAG: UDP-N-acetylglucosamine--N-acetylmuramyl-(pentapeptide) pyrophosphoryl-undecaprenol N-acetylglucosamine transferase, partial [Gammaproteobacteria bacterium]